MGSICPRLASSALQTLHIHFKAHLDKHCMSQFRAGQHRHLATVLE